MSDTIKKGATVADTEAIEKGVRNAWDFYLSLHPVSMPKIIESAIETAVGNWLIDHQAEIIEAIAARSGQ